MIARIEDAYEVFNIREDIKYGELHDITLALGIHYFWAHESYIKDRNLDEFFGLKLKSNFGMIVLRTAGKNRVRIPIEWNDIAVSALRHMMEFINYNTVIEKLEVIK